MDIEINIGIVCCVNNQNNKDINLISESKLFHLIHEELKSRDVCTFFTNTTVDCLRKVNEFNDRNLKEAIELTRKLGNAFESISIKLLIEKVVKDAIDEDKKITL